MPLQDTEVFVTVAKCDYSDVIILRFSVGMDGYQVKYVGALCTYSHTVIYLYSCALAITREDVVDI